MPSFSVFMGVLSIYYLYYQHIIYLSAHSQAQHCPPSPLKTEGMEEHNLNRVHQSSAHPTLPHGAKLGLSFGWINPVPPQNLRVPQCRWLVTTPEGLPDTCPKGLGSTWCPCAQIQHFWATNTTAARLVLHCWHGWHCSVSFPNLPHLPHLPVSVLLPVFLVVFENKL